MTLLSVLQAEKMILQTKKKSVPMIFDSLLCAHGKILGENLVANRDQPSADYSAMDGIALSYHSWQKSCRDFTIEGVQKAGIAAKRLRSARGCFEIMTGGVIPRCCDSIIPIENVKIFGSHALVHSQTDIKRFQFIRRQGSEYKKGTPLIVAGTKIKTPHIAVAASLGKSQLRIFNPKIAVIGTGDELVDLHSTPKTYQSRRSNSYALQALFAANGFTNVQRFHFNDQRATLRNHLKKILKSYDVLVLSGGVSMGKFDLVPHVLNDLNVKTLFHKVNQKPGKPLLFAQAANGTVVFGLPGNPVSTLVCARRYVVPYLQKICGYSKKHPRVHLKKNIQQHPQLTLFIPVSLDEDCNAYPVNIVGSGDYGALTSSCGFIEISPAKSSRQQGRKVPFYSW